LYAIAFHSAIAFGSSQYDLAAVAVEQTSAKAAAARETVVVGFIPKESLAEFAGLSGQRSASSVTPQRLQIEILEGSHCPRMGQPPSLPDQVRTGLGGTPERAGEVLGADPEPGDVDDGFSLANGKLADQVNCDLFFVPSVKLVEAPSECNRLALHSPAHSRRAPPARAVTLGPCAPAGVAPLLEQLRMVRLRVAQQVRAIDPKPE
jgi:hypothetical protein